MAECKHEEGARCKLLGLSLGPRECIGVNEASCPLAVLAARADAAEGARDGMQLCHCQMPGDRCGAPELSCPTCGDVGMVPRALDRAGEEAPR